MKKLEYSKLLAHRFFKSSNSSIKKFGYTYLSLYVEEILYRNNVSAKRISSEKDTDKLRTDLERLRTDLYNSLPVGLSKILPIENLYPGSKKLITTSNRLACKKYLSARFFNYIKESFQLFEQRSRLIGNGSGCHLFLSDSSLRRVKEQSEVNLRYLSSVFSGDSNAVKYLENVEKNKHITIYMQLKSIEDLAITWGYDFISATIVASAECHRNPSSGKFSSWNSMSVKDMHKEFNR